MIQKTQFAFIAGVLCCFAQTTNATVTEFINKPAWISAAGSHTTVDFTGYPGGTLITTQYSNLGVTFTDGYDQIHISPTAFPNDSAGLSNFISNIALAFAQPMSAIAVDYPGAVQFKLFWQGELFYTSSMFWVQWPSGIGGFGGLTSTQEFDQVVILDPSGDVSIDDLHFGPPIPAPGALALLGAAALLVPRRRRSP